MEEFRFTRIWLTVLLFLRLVTSESSVRLKFNDQRITSSTLKWISHSSGPILEDTVVGSVEFVLRDEFTENDLLNNSTDKGSIIERKIYICRAYVNGKWIPGALIQNVTSPNVCVVHIMAKVFRLEKYEILQNVDKSARLLWKDWETNKEIPNGAVSSDVDYIAHSASSEFKVLSNNIALGMSFLIGKIDPTLGIFGKMSVIDEKGNVNMNLNGGQVLVEDEPVLYELTVTKLTSNRKKILSKNQIILGETTLQNNDPIEMTADAVITYSWKYTSSWGPGRAMLKGLHCTIYSLNSTVENITWGLPFEIEKNGLEKAEAKLLSGTAIHVQVVGEYLEAEVPYYGYLLSVFSDNNMMNRTVNGLWKHTSLVDVKLIYGPLRFIGNNTLVPTTTTTTTSTTQASTTTTTTTMTNEIGTTYNETPRTEEKRTTVVKEEDHGMQNDQSGAMQLNKKENSDKTGSGQSICDFQSSLLTISLLLITLMYSYVVHIIT